MACLLVHDHGEGERGRDIGYEKVTERDALEEYHAFRERFEGKPEFRDFHQAFLLQRAALLRLKKSKFRV